MAQFNGNRLREAREFRGLTLGETAVLAGVTRQAISLFENNRSAPGADTLGKISRATGFPLAFFLKPSAPMSLCGPINFRKLGSATKRERAKAAVYESWLAELAGDLLGKVDLPGHNLPDFSGHDYESLDRDQLEELANQTRRHWGLGDGPISNLTLLVENNGVLVAKVPLAAGVDGLSTWRETQPLIIVSQNAPWARSRLDVAHELAHLLLHRSVTNEDLEDPTRHKHIESQAFYLGMALLFPRASFEREFYSTSLPALIDLKERWGVSIQAIIGRAYHLKLISENQRSYLYRQLSIARMRKVEPLDKEIPAETPSFLKKVIRFLSESNATNSKLIYDQMAIPASELAILTSMDEISFLPIESNKILQFRLRRENT